MHLEAFKNGNDIDVMEACLGAISTPMMALSTRLKEELKELRDTFEDSKDMSIIQEEQTERELQQQLIHNKQDRIVDDFNKRVQLMMAINRQVDQVVTTYKRQLKELAKDVMKLGEDVETLKKDKTELKQQLKYSKKMLSKDSKSLGTDKAATKNQGKIIETQLCQNCLKESNRCEAVELEKNSWKILASKIEECKQQIVMYENQIKEKDISIIKLKEKLTEKDRRKQKDQSSKRRQIEERKNQEEKKIQDLNQHKKREEKNEEEKKKLKKENTTLRGEKVVLTNQLNAIRKQLTQTVEISEMQDLQIKRLRLEVDNANTSLNWHATNLSDLRQSYHRGSNKQLLSAQQQIKTLQRINSSMFQCLKNQQNLLTEMNQKCIKMQKQIESQIGKEQKRINELESMLQDKNETIIKLKTGKGNNENSKDNEKNSYQAELIKVLNRKLSDRDDRIRSLQIALGPSNL